MGDLPSGKSPTSKARQTASVSPAAVPPRVPTESRATNHADRSNNNDLGRHDHATVQIATTIAATMFAATATVRGLGTDAGEA
jgi:hypothetical protein